jgi:hypothetical protein
MLYTFLSIDFLAALTASALLCPVVVWLLLAR